MKKIECVIELDYKEAIKLEISDFAKYIANKYIERSEDFAKLGINNFDWKAYVTELKLFFVENNLL